MSLLATSLALTNFRSYTRASFELDNKTVMVGANAAGKTNLLEALYLLASTKSFRADRELEMIHWGETAANVQAEFRHGPTVRRVSAGLAAGNRTVQKTFTIDGTKQRTREVITQFPMVLFSADDTRLIDGAPGRRRRALDLALTQSSRTYHTATATYTRVLASRNRLLEQTASGEAGSTELDFWDGQLIESGQHIVDARREFTDYLNAQLSETYRTLASASDPNKGQLKVTYRALAENLAEELPRRRAQDMAIGTTTIGPHRDDWTLLLGNRPLSSFGSGGEYRSAILAFRLVEAEWLERWLGRRPTLLLDDVFSELDQYRREALLANLPDSQVIITTPEAAILPNSFSDSALVISIDVAQRV